MNYRFRAGAIGSLLMAVLLLALFIGSSTANAQILYGSITGTVSDTVGAVVPRVAVMLTNQGTGAIRSTTANSSGTYLILDVLPGAYNDFYS